MADFDPQAMDNAANQAEEELADLDPNALATIADWWYRWFLKAGHKRLGRLMVQAAKENMKEE